MRIARKKPFGTYSPRFFRLENVQISRGISGPRAIGRIGREPYDPLAIYYEVEERRDGPLPPHLAFARLSGDDDDAKGFLERFGPLTMEEQIPYDAADDEGLNLEWRDSVHDTRQRLTNPAEYFRKFNLGPITVASQSSDPLATVNLGEFWAEQEEFLFLYLLIDAIRSGRPASEARSLLTRFVSKPPRARIGFFVLTPEIYADFQIAFGVKSPQGPTDESYGEILKKTLLPQIKKCRDQEIESAGLRLVQLRVNSRLSSTFPLLSVAPVDSGAIRGGIERSWGCRNLLGALYAMLFLDIEHRRRVVRCEGCGVLFQDAKDNVLYCSPLCETRTRVRKWWRVNGKNYRAKQRKQSNVGRKSKSVPKSAAGRSGRSHSRD